MTRREELRCTDTGHATGWAWGECHFYAQCGTEVRECGYCGADFITMCTPCRNARRAAT